MKAHTRLLGVLATAASLAVLGWGMAPPAVAAVAAPTLSIAVDNDHTTVQPGDSLTYAITIRNFGATDVGVLYITQSVATGLRFGSADSSGHLAEGNVAWRLSVPANDTATVHSTMTVGKTPPDQLRIATVACARTTVTGTPVVCASHFARLPAKGAATGTSSGTGGRLSWYLGGGAILFAALAAGTVVLVRRRRASKNLAHEEPLVARPSHRADP
jgi:uncharacterized repeat protein (TIGR01451 family)